VKFVQSLKQKLLGRKKWTLFLALSLLSVLLVVLDQVSKHVVFNTYFAKDFANLPDSSITGHSSGIVHSFIPGLFDIELAFNTGAAWSSMANAAGRILLPLLSLVMFLVFLCLGLFYSYKWPVFTRVALAFAIAGDFGNLIDRAGYLFHAGIYRYGVVDFLNFAFWPQFGATFNVADSCLVIAGILLILGYLVLGLLALADKEKKKKEGVKESDDLSAIEKEAAQKEEKKDVPSDTENQHGTHA